MHATKLLARSRSLLLVAHVKFHCTIRIKDQACCFCVITIKAAAGHSLHFYSRINCKALLTCLLYCHIQLKPARNPETDVDLITNIPAVLQRNVL